MNEINEMQNTDEKRIMILVGCDVYNRYSSLYAIFYGIFYVGMIITYAIYTPEFLDMSFNWKVFTPIIYLNVCVLVLFRFGKYHPRLRLAIKCLAHLFFLGTYHQMLYLYDNFKNFEPLFSAIVDVLSDFTEYFEKKVYWEIFALVCLFFFIILAFIIGGATILSPAIILFLKFFLLAYIAFMMLLFPFVFYFYHVFMWVTYPILLVVDYHFIASRWIK